MASAVSQPHQRMATGTIGTEISMLPAEMIPGWLTSTEISIIRKIAAMVPAGSVVIEIGAWCGRSTSAWLSGYASLVNHVVIDHWQSDQTVAPDDLMKDCDGDPMACQTAMDLLRIHGSTRPAFDLFIGFDADQGTPHGLGVISMNALDFQPSFRSSVVFMDASHDENSTHRLIRMHDTDPETLLMGHDFGVRWPGGGVSRGKPCRWSSIIGGACQYIIMDADTIIRNLVLPVVLLTKLLGHAIHAA